MNKLQYAKIGQRLKSARELRGYSLDLLSTISHEYSPKEIQQFETGHRKLDLKSLYILCHALETDMNWILNGESSREAYGFKSAFATYYGENKK